MPMFLTGSFHEFATRGYMPPPELRCFIKSIAEFKGALQHQNMRFIPA
jgi:hypothetical protein